MQIWAESGKSALPICNYSQILYQFLTFTQNLKRSPFNKISIIYGGQLARRKSLNYALIFPENILLTLFFMSMNTIFTYFRICENTYK